MLRNHYVQNRVGVRMQSRGEPMVLRRVSLLAGPVPYRNPPDVSAVVTVRTGVTVTGQAYLGLGGTTAIGRLVPGDQIITTGPVSWVVNVMPTTIATDRDGIALANGSGVPILATPLLYHADALAAGNIWRVIPVTALGGAPDPAVAIGGPVTFKFLADQPLYGVPLSFSAMAHNGWTEIDTIGVNLAAFSDSQGPIAPPKIDDLLFVNGRLRAILQVGEVYRGGVNFLYPVQAR